MGIQINGNNDTISALDGSWTSDSATHFTGKVSIGGTLTYEDVTNIDSVGLITARSGIDCNGDLDVDGHTNLDNVSIAGLTTITGGRIDVDNTGNPFKGTRFNAGADGAVLFLQHSRSNTIGTKVVLNDNDEIGAVQFRAYASDNSTIKHAASIKAEVNGTTSANGVPTDLIFNTGTTSGNAAEKVRITSTGVVSINDSTPETFATLQVKNHTGSNAAQFLLHGADMAQIILRDDTGGSNTKCTTIRNDQGAFLVGTHNDSYGGFSEKLRITSAGDVIIGSTSATTVTGAATPFQVSGSDGYTGMSIIRTASSGAQFQFAAGSNGDNVSDNDGLGYFKFYGYHTNGYDEYARIHGEVSGTNGDGDAPGALVFSTTADGASSVSERMRIDQSGAVMFGTTVTRPAEFTHPDGFAIRGDVKGQFQSTVNANSCGFLNRDSSDGNILSFRREGADVGHIGVTGSTTYIQFGGTNSAAHRLDDYEEGTFSLAWHLAGSGSAGMPSNYAHYIKVGNLVTVTFQVNTSSTSSPSGNVSLTGLPFTIKTTNGNYGNGAFGFIRDWNTDMPNLRMQGNQGTTTIHLTKHATNANEGSQHVQGSDMSSGANENYLMGTMTYIAA